VRGQRREGGTVASGNALTMAITTLSDKMSGLTHRHFTVRGGIRCQILARGRGMEPGHTRTPRKEESGLELARNQSIKDFFKIYHRGKRVGSGGWSTGGRCPTWKTEKKILTKEIKGKPKAGSSSYTAKRVKRERRLKSRGEATAWGTGNKISQGRTCCAGAGGGTSREHM